MASKTGQRSRARKLKERQSIAVDMLAGGSTGREVARDLGVREETVSRWRTNPVFTAALNQQLTEQRTATAQKLRRLAVQSIDILEAIFDDRDTSLHVRMTIAIKVLQMLKLGEHAA
ncbi:MAG TPA: hypothetical protein EYM38_04045, partial [Dehalococcoidia bacterium]|nr:hypothetical protein [Dehalococcoidia bacterium]